MAVGIDCPLGRDHRPRASQRASYALVVDGQTKSKFNTHDRASLSARREDYAVFVLPLPTV